MVDERTGYKELEFYDTKNKFIEPTFRKMHGWQSSGKLLSYIRQDNAGENKVLVQKENGKEWKLVIMPEYTGRATPQRNHLVELGFADKENKGRALLIASNLPQDVRFRLSKETFNCAMQLSNLAITKRGKSRYKEFH